MSSDRETEGRPAAGSGVAERPPSPFRLNLEQQRKRAKDLLRDLRAGEAEARARFARHHSQASRPDAVPARLSDAQLVVARELGLPSWPRLKAHILALERSWQGILRDADAGGSRGAKLDGDVATLHIRCGSDIGPTLRAAGFVGDFLEYSDPLCQGPVIDASDWLERRIAFVADTYGAGSGQSPAQIATKLTAAEARLQAAASRYDRVVLWFEHDSYDQLILARCLAQFAQRVPARLELISAGSFPGSVRFIGLGQLPPEGLRLLWEARLPVSEAALREGETVWRMLRAPDPAPLVAFARAGTRALPQLGRAVLRHCRELPAADTGLALTERLILELLAEQPETVGRIYARLMLEREPLPWMTDLMIDAMVKNMKRAEAPAFEGAFEDATDGEGQHWSDERLTITALGRAVLAGEVDWLSLRPPPRWVGGVHISSMPPCWRWDEGAVRYR